MKTRQPSDKKRSRGWRHAVKMAANKETMRPKNLKPGAVSVSRPKPSLPKMPWDEENKEGEV